MNKKLILPIVIFLAAFALWKLMQPSTPPSPGEIATAPKVPGAANVVTPSDSSVAPPEPAIPEPPQAQMAETAAVPPPSAPSNRFAQLDLSKSTQPDRDAARNDVENISLMLRDFRTVQGDNPVGSNAEIMKAIMGGNKKGATLGPPEGQNLNANGELVDRWGTPVFFHQMSANEMEIRSAGPDQKLWTSDDVIAR
jgi:hypothetical protein